MKRKKKKTAATVQVQYTIEMQNGEIRSMCECVRSTHTHMHTGRKAF